MYNIPRIGDLVWFSREKGEKAELGQLRDVYISDDAEDGTAVVVCCQKRDQVLIDASLVQCRKLITAKGPLGDSSISWKDWQHLSYDEKERLAWPYGSGK